MKLEICLVVGFMLCKWKIIFKVLLIVCYINGFCFYNLVLDKLKFICSCVYFKLYLYKIVGCCLLVR